jgi:hypothetical protein
MMSPLLIEALAAEHAHDLHRAAAAHRAASRTRSGFARRSSPATTGTVLRQPLRRAVAALARPLAHPLALGTRNAASAGPDCCPA